MKNEKNWERSNMRFYKNKKNKKEMDEIREAITETTTYGSSWKWRWFAEEIENWKEKLRSLAAEHQKVSDKYLKNFQAERDKTAGANIFKHCFDSAPEMCLSLVCCNISLNFVTKKVSGVT